MTRQQIIGVVKWTMLNYGSDAGERIEQGSKLQAQAEHIADAIQTVLEVQASLTPKQARFVRVIPYDPYEG